MTTLQIPPIKCQGIKSKLVVVIQAHLDWSANGTWIEPFMGSGVVGFNIRAKRAIFADTNPHLINFYTALNQSLITPPQIRLFLEEEGQKLNNSDGNYYYEVRERFNVSHEPLDFLFLNRACFNGVIRFNRKGGFNVPFNHKPERFSKAYITKIVNQVKAIHELCQLNDWQFICQDFSQTLAVAQPEDFIYCDPPYLGRHVDYFDSWSEEQEQQLYSLLNQQTAQFMLSTWHSNMYRTNTCLEQLWSKFHIVKQEHFYHVGAQEINRQPMIEALVMNYQPKTEPIVVPNTYHQPILLEQQIPYQTPLLVI